MYYIHTRRYIKYTSGYHHRETRLLNSPNLRPECIQNLSTSYKILLTIINKVNSCYTLQVCKAFMNIFVLHHGFNFQFIFCISITFFFLVINFFVFYKTLTIGIEHKSPVLEIFFTTRSIYFNFLLYKAISVGSKIKNSVHTFKKKERDLI